MVKWILHSKMEAEPDMAVSYLDANNAFGNLERPCIRTATEANEALHPMIPMNDVSYTRG